MDEPQAILVVKGTGGDNVTMARRIGCVAVVLIVGGSFALSGDSGARSSSAFDHPAFPVRFLILGALAGAYLAERFVRPSTGTVEFYADKVTFVKHRSKMGGTFWFSSQVVADEEDVRWADITGFRDGEAGHVDLVVAGVASSLQTIPTLNENDRVAVLKLLDEKGVRRVE